MQRMLFQPLFVHYSRKETKTTPTRWLCSLVFNFWRYKLHLYIRIKAVSCFKSISLFEARNAVTSRKWNGAFRFLCLGLQMKWLREDFYVSHCFQVELLQHLYLLSVKFELWLYIVIFLNFPGHNIHK